MNIINSAACLHSRTACAARLLPLLLLTLPGVVQAQDYTYTTNSGAITITKYTGSGGDVTIPDAINGLPVTSIGGNAFYNRTNITSVTIPNSVTSIGTSAFSYCSRMGSVTIGESVVSIGSYAFYSCRSLTSVRIPGSVDSIGVGAFSGYSSLSAITVDAGNSVYSSVEGVLFANSQTMLIQYPSAKAGGYTIPNSVTYIRTQAFLACTNLTSVTIPDSVTSISSYAFYACSSLTNVTIPDSVVYIESDTFNSCTRLTKITIPNNVRSIGSAAFYYTALTSVTIPNSVTNIGDQAFEYCTSLTGVFFEGNAPDLGGSSVFDYDYNATVYYLPGTMGWGATFGGRPTALWIQQVQPSISGVGVRTNRFGFTINGTSNLVIMVEACTNPANPIWSPVGTNTLTNGTSYFSDPQWANYPRRFYRLRSP